MAAVQFGTAAARPKIAATELTALFFSLSELMEITPQPLQIPSRESCADSADDCSTFEATGHATPGPDRSL